MDQEAADELVGAECHRLLLVVGNRSHPLPLTLSVAAGSAFV
jgi:hypothetical protein